MADPNVHDSFVYHICHRLEDRGLTIFSHFRDRDIPKPYFKTDFTNVVANHFQHVAAPSILFDIDVQSILSTNEPLFKNGLKYGWPFSGLHTIGELADRLTVESIKGYAIMGTCGFDGFVLASFCSITAAASPHPRS